MRTRFAPSPTGSLHVGGVRTALLNWMWARKHGGEFLLRIEDTGKVNVPNNGIIEGLQWLGLDWDRGAFKADSDLYFQSKRTAIYEREIGKLLDTGHAYVDKEGVTRLHVPNETVTVSDLIAGPTTTDFAAISPPPKAAENWTKDLALRRSDGSFIFHFVNVVDDIDMEITHVIRGEDHLSNTPKHLLLYRAFGAKPPEFAHLPLLLMPDRKKMSKSDKGAPLSDYQDQSPIPLLNYLCGMSWKPGSEIESFNPLDPSVYSLLELRDVSKRNAIFDTKKQASFSGLQLRALPPDEFAKNALKSQFLPPHYAEEPTIMEALKLCQEKVSRYRDCYPLVRQIYDSPKDGEDIDANLLRTFLPVPATAADIGEKINLLSGGDKKRKSTYVYSLRQAVTGEKVGLSLFHMMELMGEQATVRITEAIRRTEEILSTPEPAQIPETAIVK